VAARRAAAGTRSRQRPFRQRRAPAPPPLPRLTEVLPMCPVQNVTYLLACTAGGGFDLDLGGAVDLLEPTDRGAKERRPCYQVSRPAPPSGRGAGWSGLLARARSHFQLIRS
jgi:hypothetical protein